MFRHVLQPSCSRVLPTSPKGCPHHNYELDVNGLNYDGAKKLDRDPRPREGVRRRDARPVDHPLAKTISAAAAGSR